NTTTIHEKTIAFFSINHAKCKILFSFLHQPVAKVPARYKLSILSKERRIVDGEEHVHRRLIHADYWQCFGIFRIRDRISNVEVFNAYNRTKVTRNYFTHLLLSHSFKNIKLTHLRLPDVTI